MIPGGVDAWTDPSPPPPAPPPPPPPITPAADDTKNLPVSPEAAVGITFGAVVAIGVVMVGLLYRATKTQGSAPKRDSQASATSPTRLADALVKADIRKKAKRMLFIGFTDGLFDWMGFVLAFYAEDMEFHNDPGHVMRTFIMVVCALGTASWFLQYSRL